MKRYWCALLLMALPLAAQEEKKPEAKIVPDVKVSTSISKLFVLKYADPDRIANLLRVFNAVVTPNTEMHALAVRGDKESMNAIEDAITRLDVPAAAPKNIDLMVYYVIGADGENNLGGPLPKDLDSAVAALKTTFPFKEYRLLDVMTIRTRVGQRVDTNSNAGALTLEGLAAPITNSFHMDSSSLSPDGTTVRLDRMRSMTRFPYRSGNSVSYSDLGINQDMDIKEGQKAVVGRVGIAKDQALFLVLSAKVVQ
ncbi:MAG: hypothetical protein LAP87_05395 [Acidobacteriia bacterium]|nr:hypothetical protein [Terriglobia bacterium]